MDKPEQSNPSPISCKVAPEPVPATLHLIHNCSSLVSVYLAREQDSIHALLKKLLLKYLAMTDAIRNEQTNSCVTLLDFHPTADRGSYAEVRYGGNIRALLQKN